MNFNDRDDFLEERIHRYDTWISERKIPAPSRVIPIQESLDNLQWVLPTNQAIEILRNARIFALQNCECRIKYQRCDKPIEVCFLINDVAEKALRQGEAKSITFDAVIQTLKLANENGLVHLAIYNPEQHIFALCSCCDCCCHQIQIMKMYKRPDFIAHSDYIVEVDEAKCIQCGNCAERCAFGAQVKNNTIEYHRKYCYGCGLCLTTCPTGAISLILR